MAIRILSDSIKIGNFTLEERSDGLGINFNGAAKIFGTNLVGGTFIQGTVSGYNSGGFGPASPPVVNIIDKFPFASDANATDVGNLTLVIGGAAGQSSKVSGYTSGGLSAPPAPSHLNVINKFPFATDTNATDVGDLASRVDGPAGNSSATNGYASAGFDAPPAPHPSGVNQTRQKFSFAADSNAIIVGNLAERKSNLGAQNSDTTGYVTGGQLPSPNTQCINSIEKFSFSSEVPIIQVGQLLGRLTAGTGQSSTTHGYMSGGYYIPPNPNAVNLIQKFSFAADANATDVGDLTRAASRVTGQSSTVSGYTCGGKPSPPAANTNTIDKFPFSTDTNATDVGDLTEIRGFTAGQQV